MLCIFSRVSGYILIADRSV